MVRLEGFLFLVELNLWAVGDKTPQSEHLSILPGEAEQDEWVAKVQASEEKITVQIARELGQKECHLESLDCSFEWKPFEESTIMREDYNACFWEWSLETLVTIILGNSEEKTTAINMGSEWNVCMWP